ncbi:hypothetical protein [Phytohabitans houttuyneae]|uniref:Uncharacterized protein n=1 Tax=Phytohabitans houttuyneae TaxID=1076126 RepID=A0A6V8KAD9_9ACTN|nr:hypothetical protein [Phytohabitans houttuyneae]GFJ79421.1 hypothetical protein Phou_036010 [Phytohabitans houttuyneae]
MPQPYPLWIATSPDRVARIVAWTEVDGQEGLFPVVFQQGAAAAEPIMERGWLGDTRDRAMIAAEEAVHPPAWLDVPDAREPSVGVAVAEATMEALERERRQR